MNQSAGTNGLGGTSVRGGAITLAAQALKFLLQMSSTMLLARMLAPGDFGLFAMTSSAIAFASVFREAGLSTATVQAVAISDLQLSKLFWINGLIGFVLTLALVTASPIIAWVYGDERLVIATSVLSCVVFLGALGVQHRAILKRRLQFRLLAIIDVGALLVGIVVGASCGAAGMGFMALIWMGVATGLAEMLLSWAVGRWTPSAAWKNVNVRGLTRFGASVLTFDVINYFSRNADNLIIGRALGAAPLGIYSKAYSLLLLPIRQVTTPFASVVLPVLAKLQSSPVEFRVTYLNAVRSLAFINFPIVGFTFVFAEEVVAFILGNGWDQAVPVFRLLAPAAVVGAINVAPGWLCVALGRPHKQLWYGLVSMPVYITSFLIGLNWGVTGVAACFGVTFFVFYWLFLAYACRGTAVSLMAVVQALFVPALASSTAAFICWLMKGSIGLDWSTVTLLFVGFGVCVISYAAVALMAPSTRRLVSECWFHMQCWRRPRSTGE